MGKTDFERKIDVVKMIAEINEKKGAEVIKLRENVESYDFAIFDHGEEENPVFASDSMIAVKIYVSGMHHGYVRLTEELNPEFVGKIGKIMEKKPIKVDNLKKR